MSDFGSVSELIEKLQHEDSQAARQLWDRYISRLIETAQNRLLNTRRRVADEEDVALSAFDAFIRGAKVGRFKQLSNREDLWQILAMLVERKSADLLRRELADKRGGGQVRGDSAFNELEQSPNPVAVDRFTLEMREMLQALEDEQLQRLALKKFEGYTNQEIANEMNISLRAVERKLSLIRQKWESYR